MPCSSPAKALFNRFLSSTDISESMPRVEEPDRGIRRRRQAEHGLDLALQERNQEDRPARMSVFPPAGSARRSKTSSARLPPPRPSKGALRGRGDVPPPPLRRRSSPSTSPRMSATSSRISRSIAFRPCCGVNQRPPRAERCLSIRSFCSAASPISDQAPHAMACPGRPIARR